MMGKVSLVGNCVVDCVRSPFTGSGKKRDIDEYDFYYKHLDDDWKLQGHKHCRRIIEDFDVDGLYTEKRNFILSMELGEVFTA